MFNLDESPINRDWIRSKWTRKPYKSQDFMNELEELGETLDEFKTSAMYLRAVQDGLIVDDEWRPEALGFE